MHSLITETALAASTARGEEIRRIAASGRRPRRTPRVRAHRRQR